MLCLCSSVRYVYVPVYVMFMFQCTLCICSSVRYVYVPVYVMFMFQCTLCLCSSVRYVYVPVYVMFMFQCTLCLCSSVRYVYVPVYALCLCSSVRVMYTYVPVYVDDCASDPCQNGGNCTDYIDLYTCTCLDGYEGYDCQAGKLFSGFICNEYHIPTTIYRSRICMRV